MSRECSYANKLDPNIGRRIANEHRSTFAFDAKTSEKKKIIMIIIILESMSGSSINFLDFYKKTYQRFIISLIREEGKNDIS